MPIRSMSESTRLPPFEARLREMSFPSHMTQPIKKIIWSSFDYTTGPIFNLSLKLNHSESDCYYESVVSSSSQDNSSDPGQYEDIDDAFANELLTATDDTLNSFVNDDCEYSVNSVNQFYHCCTINEDNNGNHSEDVRVSTTISPVGKEMEISAVDSGISTNYSVHSDLSQGLCNSTHHDDSMTTYADMEEVLNESNLTSQYISPSARPLTPNPYMKSMLPEEQRFNMYLPTVQEQNELFTNVLNEACCFEQPSDEKFIMKHALSEQITGQFMSCNPIVTKISVIPSRMLFYVTYISWPVMKTGPAMTSISVLMDLSQESWYHQNKYVIDTFFDRLVTTFTHRIERFFSYERQCNFLMENVEHLVHILANIQPFGVGSRTMNVLDSDLLLITKDRKMYEFLLKCIAGTIMSRGHTFIHRVDDFHDARKLLTTLALFLDEERRLVCTTEFASRLNAFTSLQLVTEKEEKELNQQCLLCDWPACVINVRDRTVSITGQYWEHKKRFKDYQIAMTDNVLRRRDHIPSVSSLPMREIKELPKVYRNVLNTLPHVVPRSRVINHFHQVMQNEAEAFINTLKAFSEPSAMAKANPYSAEFKLSDVLNACHLKSPEAIGIVMANAESAKPSLAQFIYENAQISK